MTYTLPMLLLNDTEILELASRTLRDMRAILTHLQWLVEQRDRARHQRDFTHADEIAGQLTLLGMDVLGFDNARKRKMGGFR